MEGCELKRLREAAGLTQEQLADKMIEWGWYREKVIRYEQSRHFCLHLAEMQALLNALGAEN
jgi:transcriptional regulator with XRE-family HTH domain